jgi:uncharacterized protein Yka (UPF0111/DUF47 family)
MKLEELKVRLRRIEWMVKHTEDEVDNLKDELSKSDVKDDNDRLYEAVMYLNQHIEHTKNVIDTVEYQINTLKEKRDESSSNSGN